jgi:hypothetical protein
MNLFSIDDDVNMCGSYDKQSFGQNTDTLGVPGFNISPTMIPLPRNAGMPQAFMS